MKLIYVGQRAFKRNTTDAGIRYLSLNSDLEAASAVILSCLLSDPASTWA